MDSINPHNAQLLKSYENFSSQKVSATLQRAGKAFVSWRGTSFEERSLLMRNAAGVLRARRRELAEMMAREMGKVLKEGDAEIEKCAAVCEYYADNAKSFLANKPIASDAASSYVAFDPLGAVLAIMPWNFPFWQVFRFAAPTIMAGNVGLLKHASNVSACSLAIEEIFVQAGFPPAVFSSLLVPGDAVEALIADPIVKAVTLTGSTKAGRSVAEVAGRHLKTSVMELGGSDPYIILADADLKQAASTCVKSRLINAGQSCIAAKRFIAVDSVAAEFEDLFIEEMKTVKWGDPFDPANQIGPQAKVELRDELHQQVKRSMQAGAHLALGGTLPSGAGAYYPPTVLTAVKPGMAAFDEELFGPVAALIRAKDDQEALALANQSPFGLGAALFTSDTEKAELYARQLDAGSVFINALVKSDPRLPFGGVKQSGYGRELSHFGIQEFVNIKTIYRA